MGATASIPDTVNVEEITSSTGESNRKEK